MKKIEIQTGRRTEMVDITVQVREAVAESGIGEGLCIIYSPHTTAGITINEGADAAVKADILAELEKVIPFDDGYSHLEGNSAGHIKTSLTGSSATVIIDAGRPVLGTWQAIFLCEFDGPRQRKAIVKCISV